MKTTSAMLAAGSLTVCAALSHAAEPSAPVSATKQATPKACEVELSFDRLQEMSRQTLGFERRLNYIYKSLAEEEHRAYVAGDSQRANAIGAESTQVVTVRESLSNVWGFLYAAANLALAHHAMVDGGDRAFVLDQLQDVASDAKPILASAMDSTEDIVTTTRRPGVGAEASKLAEFLAHTRDTLAACAGSRVSGSSH